MCRFLLRGFGTEDLLHGALAVECSKDIITLPAMERLLGTLLEVHQGEPLV